MSHPRHIAITFSLAMAAVLAAMGWITYTVVRLDREQATAKQAAALEENVRLALWRMDSAIGPFIAHESGRPPTEFNDLPMASRGGSTEGVVLLFQFETDGKQEVAIQQQASMQKQQIQLPQGTQQVTESPQPGDTRLVQLLRQADLPSRLPVPLTQPAPLQPPAQEAGMVALGQQLGAKGQKIRSQKEYQSRAMNQVMFNQAPGWASRSDVRVGLLKALWVDGRLVLARRVFTGERQYVQGAVLNWPTIRASLLARVSDLLPNARLVPVHSGQEEHEARMMAALPVRIIPGDPPSASIDSPSPLLFSLTLAWICVLLAALAVGVLLWGAVRLSERRAAFVSAVTHELRTPLTTLRTPAFDP